MPSETQLRAIFDSLGDGLFVASPEGRYLEINPAGCSMMGYSLDEFRDLVLSDVLDPSELPRLGPVLEAIAEGRLIRSEWRFRRKDGQTFVGELVGGKLPDGRIQAVVRDMTERIQLATREEVLRHEAGHRTKNILSVVQAVARQTKGESREEFLTIFERRIAALANSHDLVIASSWGPIDLQALIETQLHAFAGRKSDRVTISGPSLKVNAVTAQTLGLALHELATNAAKYGALANADGQISVGWSVGGEVPRFTLMWRESGGPPVTPPQHRGFGSKLVGEISGRTLGGQSQLDYPAAGLVWTLDCPMAAVTN